MNLNLKYIFIIFLALSCFTVDAQNRKGRKRIYGDFNSRRPDKNDQFLMSQWWLGFRAGANLTKAEPTETYSSFSPVNYELAPKNYDQFKHLGGQAGIEVTYYHRGFSFSLQPNYRRQIFGYTNMFSWKDAEVPENTVELNYNQVHRIDYLEIPLFLKYDITKGYLRPFVQVGAYYGMLSGAEKEIEVTGTDAVSGNLGSFNNNKESFGVEQLFITSTWGVAGGVGVSYDRWNTRVILDITYRQGMSNITDVSNRFSDNPMSGIGDAMDDIELQNITLNIGILFPLRFISKDYDAVN